jgi:non-ribosomal peptide synthetase component F
VISPFDMSFYLWEENDQIKGEIEYSTDLLKHETILRLKNNLVNLISNLVENPDVSLKSISLISDAEKKMNYDLNDTATEYPKDKTIIQLFEDQVSCYSEKTAVVFKSLTYNQLNRKAIS